MATNNTKFVKGKKHSAVVYFMHKRGAFYIPKVSHWKCGDVFQVDICFLVSCISLFRYK